MVCAGCPASAPGARVSCLQPMRTRLVRASSCPNSGGSSFSGHLKKLRVVRARSCPIWGGSSMSRHSLRTSLVRACSCPISGDSTSRLLLRRSSPWTRSSLHVTPSHERATGLSPSGHHFCSAGLAARIARSASSS
eukprot:scaffold24992_cov63-Phaeocystis_antarctica.AAC.6